MDTIAKRIRTLERTLRTRQRLVGQLEQRQIAALREQSSLSLLLLSALLTSRFYSCDQPADELGEGVGEPRTIETSEEIRKLGKVEARKHGLHSQTVSSFALSVIQWI